MIKEILSLLTEGGQPFEMQILHTDGDIDVPPNFWDEMKLGELEKILFEAHHRIEYECKDKYNVLFEANQKANAIGFELSYGLSGEIDGIYPLREEDPDATDNATILEALEIAREEMRNLINANAPESIKEAARNEYRKFNDIIIKLS
jgi:hypothetical protein